MFTHELFYALHARGLLPGVAAVEVQLKQGAIMSEFTRYRYNVLLHMGVEGAPPPAPLPLVIAEQTPEPTAASVAAALGACAAAHGASVVAWHGLMNARLTADVLLRDGVADAAAPAVQRGVGDGGGIDPHALRTALAERLPAHHIVLTWARDGTAHLMDVYAIPRAACGGGVAAGLATVAQAVASAMAAGVLHDAPIASFSNVIESVDAEKKDAAADEAAAAGALAEARVLWETEEPTKREAAVLAIACAKLGVAPSAATGSAAFSQLGGNSFQAMQAVATVRGEFGVNVPIFELLTKTLAAFAASVVRLATESAAPPQWVVVAGAPRGFRSVHDRGEPACPTFVFFPAAGSSPKQFASVYSELARRCPLARSLFVSPPGRDARAGEENVTDLGEWLDAAYSALQPHLVGADARPGPCVFVGDSWGAIAAFATAHRLREKDGFVPTHVVVSGNASPSITSTHCGLGSYCDTPLDQISDDGLRAFLAASGIDNDNEGAVVVDELLAPFRADCGLYEAYVRPDGLPQLHCRLAVLRGADDGVTTRSEMLGWLDEFDTNEVKIISVARATHHAYEEQPAVVAAHLANLVAGHTAHTIEISKPVAVNASPLVAHAPVAPDRKLFLGPPCDFIRGVDAAELKRFREGNLLYRAGSHHGSRGELSALTRNSSAASLDAFESTGFHRIESTRGLEPGGAHRSPTDTGSPTETGSPSPRSPAPSPKSTPKPKLATIEASPAMQPTEASLPPPLPCE